MVVDYNIHVLRLYHVFTLMPYSWTDHFYMYYTYIHMNPKVPEVQKVIATTSRKFDAANLIVSTVSSVILNKYHLDIAFLVHFDMGLV